MPVTSVGDILFAWAAPQAELTLSQTQIKVDRRGSKWGVPLGIHNEVSFI